MKTANDITAKQRLLSGAVLPIMLGVTVGGLALVAGVKTPARADSPGAVASYRSAVAGNPTALPRAAKPGSRRLPTQLAGACGARKKTGCGACGAKTCGACGAKTGACGAKKSACGASNPCNPCGAASGGGGASTVCVVPRLAKANPCGAKKCGACGAKKGGACGASNACGATKKAKMGACGACGAKKAPCGACGAKKAANPCSPCGASSGGGPVKLTDKEAHAAYDCLRKELKTAYAKAGVKSLKGYSRWRRFNTVSYQSATHGSRYVNNYANHIAQKRYARFEKAGRLPKGSVLAKDSFTVRANGQLVPGPLFSMEKMRRGWNKASLDWRYTMIMPNGSVFGITKGKGSAKMKFCAECHNLLGAKTDAMTFMPKEYRKK